MAQQGFYTDPPNRRMAYDEDGSILVHIHQNGTIEERSTDSKRAYNTEAHTLTSNYGLGDPPLTYALLFPELRNVTHMYRNLIFTGAYNAESFSSALYGSTNTTNGLDGDWTNLGTLSGDTGATNPAFRSPQVMSGTDLKGVKYTGPNSGTYYYPHFAQWHVYGYKSAGQTPHRIDFCDVGGNELAIDFDYGDQPRNSSRTWSPSNTWNQASALYLRNRSNTKQATDVNVTFEVLSGDLNQYVGISKDNIAFGGVVNYATINPQQIVGPIYVRHNPTLAASLGVKAGRLQCSVGTWL